MILFSSGCKFDLHCVLVPLHLSFLRFFPVHNFPLRHILKVILRAHVKLHKIIWNELYTTWPPGCRFIKIIAANIARETFPFLQDIAVPPIKIK